LHFETAISWQNDASHGCHGERLPSDTQLLSIFIC
jgi:hypothetical protein